MINLKMLYKVLGSLLLIEAIMLILCLVLSWCYAEDDIFTFAISTVLTYLGAITLRYFGRDANNTMSRRDSFLVVTCSWVLFSLFGTLPFLVGGYITNFTDAFFESMSAFSTTGTTVLNCDQMPHGILFWRSLSQWIGGLGIVFFTIAILPGMTGGSIQVFSAEATGPVKAKLHPKLSTSAKWIWSIYTLLTILCVLALYLLGVGWFDALNYGLTTTATGGFATHDNPETFYASPAVDYTITLFCFLSGINFVLLYTAFIKLKFKRLFTSLELRVYCSIIITCTLCLTLDLLLFQRYDFEHAIRTALFSVVSFATTTGIVNQSTIPFAPVSWILLAIIMIIGGMSGSTTGGLKVIRSVIFWKMIKNEFRQLLHPNAILPLNIDGANIGTQRRASLMSLIAIYIALLFIGIIILTLTGLNISTALSLSLACLTNSGYLFPDTVLLDPSIIPNSEFQIPNSIATWLCSFFMLMGRLEIFTVLLIFTPNYWREN